VTDEQEERMEVKVLGRVLGTASGWDGDPGETVWFYDFQAVSGLHLPFTSLAVDFLNGYIGTLDNETGEFTKNSTNDIVLFLSGVPRT